MLHLKYRKHIIAEDGQTGGSSLSTGARGKDVVLEVPLGTVAKHAETGEFLFEITEEGQEQVLLPGGRGGQGNTHYKSSTNQTPRYAQPGEPFQEGWRILEHDNQVVRRFFALDTRCYEAGALDVRTKELMGLAASLMLPVVALVWMVVLAARAFALLAVFPAIAILIGFYKAVLSIGQVSEQAAALGDIADAETGDFRRAETNEIAAVEVDPAAGSEPPGRRASHAGAEVAEVDRDYRALRRPPASRQTDPGAGRTRARGRTLEGG